MLSIDGVDQGERTQFRGPLSPGQHLIKAVSRDGTMSAELKVNIVAGDTLRPPTLTLQAKP